MKVVYATLYNSDSCEGRGPMVIDKVFSNRRDAEDYIDDKPGLMGRKAKWSAEQHGDWKIVEYTVFNSLPEAREDARMVARRKALSKLSAEDYEALGIRR